MSDYFQAFDPIAKERYLQKLRLLGLHVKDDPYTNLDKFVDDMTLWPPVEFGHIFCYFVERPAHTLSESSCSGRVWTRITTSRVGMFVL